MDYDFFVLPGVAINSSNMDYGPPDAENQVYDSNDAPFDLGYQVWDAGRVYKSLVDNNSAPLSDGASWLDEGETDLGALLWVAGTYILDEYRVYNSRLWRSAIDNNSTEPSSDNDDWTDFGPTNRFKAFDTFLEDNSVGTTSMKFEVTPGQRVTSLIILKPVGSEVNITVSTPESGIVEQRMYRTTRDTGGRHWKYFNSPVRRVSSLTIEDLPPQVTATITIEFTSFEGGEVGAGQIIMGLGEATAEVVVGSGTGMESNSVKDVNAFGRPVIVGYPPAKRVTFALRMFNTEVDNFSESLFEREALPTAFYMREGAPYGVVVYGIFEDFYVDHDNPVTSTCNLVILGFN